MNIRNFREMDLPAMDTSDRLVVIFNNQEKLREKYILIETGNGFHCPISANLHDAKDQHALKDLAWRTVEELAEAMDAATIHENGWDHDHSKEEVADALHFLVEMALLSGIDPLVFRDNKPGDSLTRLFARGLQVYQASTKAPDTLFATFVTQLGMVCHTLKNKPWKQTQLLTDVKEYKSRLCEAFIWFAAFCHSVKLNDADLFDLYHRKSQVNEFRQRSNY